MFGRRAKTERFETVVETYGRRLAGFAVRLVGNPDVAQDIVQDAFIRLAAGWRGAFEPSPQMAAWLHAAVRNLAVDHLRREARRAELHRRESLSLDAAEAPSPGQGGGGEVPDDAVRAAEALATLDARSREIVVLRVYEEKSYQEIADATGLPAGTVGYLLHEAFRKLARALRPGKEVHP